MGQAVGFFCRRPFSLGEAQYIFISPAPLFFYLKGLAARARAASYIIAVELVRCTRELNRTPVVAAAKFIANACDQSPNLLINSHALLPLFGLATHRNPHERGKHNPQAKAIFYSTCFCGVDFELVYFLTESHKYYIST